MHKVSTLLQTIQSWRQEQRSRFRLPVSVASPEKVIHSKDNLSLLRKGVTEEQEMQVVVPMTAQNQSSLAYLQKKLGEKFCGAVCDIRDSPMRIIKAAASGNLEELDRLMTGDEKRLNYRDKKGRTALHHAASQNRVECVQFIHEHGGDINAQDYDGNTALHLAVESNALETISYLLSNKADSSIRNNEMNGPIHLATELNRVEVLEEMVNHKSQVDTCLRGKHGRRALHVAAIYDHADCARILLSQLKCCPRIPCDNGYYPIHEAAKNGSANAMAALLEWGESIGVSRQEMLKLYDTDGNVPLHSAVHSGDIKAVNLCLESGALISTQQHDLSTPVHLACAQGAIEIVKLMFNAQPEEKSVCLNTSDAQQMTPLHCAAMFDHDALVEYLVNEGANINAVDKEGRTVLLLAAARSAWKVMKVLLQSGAEMGTQDNMNRNLLHHIVLAGGSLEDFWNYLNQHQGSSIASLMNERDVHGCTPMHYASRTGHLKTIRSLLRLGAVVNLKNNDNQSPLHFAARYGRYNTVRHLLESNRGTLIINEMDGEGKTPLHIASENGHTRVVYLLLVKGALLHRDHKGRTPMHYAAMNGYTQTIEQLLSFHSHLLDQMDRDGNTALHLAAMNNKPESAKLLLTLDCGILRNNQDMTPVDFVLYFKHSEVAMVMVTHETRNAEVLKSKLKMFGCVVEGLTAVMPDVMMAVLDRCISKYAFIMLFYKYTYVHNRYGLAAREFCIKQDVLHSGSGLMALTATRKGELLTYHMVRYKREELLSHRLCVKYLETKWNSYGMYFHLMNLFVYTIFLALVTANAISLMDNRPKYPNHISNLLNNSVDNGSSGIASAEGQRLRPHAMCSVNALVVLVFVALNIIKEFYQMYTQRVKYFLDIINTVEWGLYITSGLLGATNIIPGILDYSTDYIVAAIAVFLAWFNYLLYLQRFNRVGIYVVMFLEILSTLLRVMLVFSVLIIAFGLSFFILLGKIEGLEEKGFYNPGISLVRVGTMMLGEVDFLGTFLRPLRSLVGPMSRQLFAAIVFLMGFAILMPILLMNLLIGLAVGDIETVRRNAQLKRLTMQVESHTDLERKLPENFLKLVDKMEVCEYPNRTNVSSYLWSTIHSWFASPQEDSGQRSPHLVDGITDTSDDLGEQLHEQKKKLSDISKAMSEQLQLLRLIVQKMEIRTENEDMDEGEYDCIKECTPSELYRHVTLP
ncbi:transient receptor potential cation channel subfamily A member 1-like [Limulus polyphemus]|uniref:Transient receptor potential cation channel subfamily A member 1-like n=1 Tax=Limulus polyphemus TaxID=6850 RepID=A0ABM1SI81_LIMPO|nr:transient receptor potential cation channel subfamily A member 1-like [Limulus polyphemus]